MMKPVIKKYNDILQEKMHFATLKMIDCDRSKDIYISIWKEKVYWCDLREKCNGMTWNTSVAQYIAQ
jgi:hypothetical protein